MTIETWMTEAGLPITEKPATELEAAKMSLRKWEAMRGEVLECHGINFRDIVSCRNAEACGLCHFHARYGDRHGLSYVECGNCVLDKAGDGCLEDASPWDQAMCGLIEPMISALKQAVKTLEEEQCTPSTDA